MATRQIMLTIPCDGVNVEAELTLPEPAHGVVIFAHGSGSSRFSSRNRHVARRLQHSGLATLLLDLLTREEEALDAESAELRFDIGLLTQRLLAATTHLAQLPDTRRLALGYFGASTGAAAALCAAAFRPDLVRAVVSRGGRPDLAGELLERVGAPTLLIVGGNDHAVLELNRVACKQLGCERRLDIVPGATHLFEEEGALDEVARLAVAWLTRYLTPAEQPTVAPQPVTLRKPEA